MKNICLFSEAAAEIENVVRGLLYLSQRNQILNTVCSEHFVVTFKRKPWKISQKIAFKKYGKVLKVCPFLFEVRITCKKSYLNLEDHERNSLTQNADAEYSSTSGKTETRASRRRGGRNLDDGISRQNDNEKPRSESRCSSAVQKTKKPLKRLPSRRKRTIKHQRLPSKEVTVELSCDQDVTSSSSSENEESNSEDEVRSKQKKKKMACKSQFAGDWMDKTQIVVNSPDTHLNTSGDIPLNVLAQMSANKRKRQNESILLNKTSTRRADLTMQAGKSFHATLDTVEEKDVQDILGTSVKKSKTKHSAADTTNMSVLEQSCKEKRGLKLYKVTNEPMMNLPSVENSLNNSPPNVTQQLNFKDTFLSPSTVSKEESNVVDSSLTPLRRFDRNEHEEGTNKKSKGINFPVKDRHLTEREEIAEDIKLQEMSKADDSHKNSGTRLSFGKSLWETLDTYFISPVKTLFDGK